MKDQPTDQGIHVLTRDFSTLAREKCHGSSTPDLHETRISRVTRIVSGRVGLGQDVLKFSRVGSVGSRSLEILTGRVGSADPTREKP